MSINRDTSLGPLNQGSPPRDASLRPQHASHVPDASDADPTASRLPGTAGMLPSRGIPPIMRPHDLHMLPACTTACPNPQACPQGSWTPARQPAGRPKLRHTPAAVHPTVTRPHAYSTHLVCQMTCPTLGHVLGHVARQPGVTQATRSTPIAQPTAVEHLAPAVPPLGLGRIPRPQNPRKTWGDPPRMLNVGRRPGITQPPDTFSVEQPCSGAVPHHLGRVLRAPRDMRDAASRLQPRRARPSSTGHLPSQ